MNRLSLNGTMAKSRIAAARVGIGGPVGSGKTALVERLIPALLKRGVDIAVITNDLVTAEDARSLWPVVRPVFARAWSHSPFRKDLPGIEVDEILDAARPMLDETLTLTELGRRLEARWPGRSPASLSYAARFLLPIVQVPPRGLWGRSGQARWRRLDSWTGKEGGERPDATTVGDLVLRYLAAFGPATPADIATWSWLTGYREVLESLRPRLRTFRDEAGRELFDVPDAPIPRPDTPAPFRFLPEYDNVALSHASESLPAAS